MPGFDWCYQSQTRYPLEGLTLRSEQRPLLFQTAHARHLMPPCFPHSWLDRLWAEMVSGRFVQAHAAHALPMGWRWPPEIVLVRRRAALTVREFGLPHPALWRGSVVGQDPQNQQASTKTHHAHRARTLYRVGQ